MSSAFPSYLKVVKSPSRTDVPVRPAFGTLLGFVDMSRTTDVALESILALQPECVFDLRPVPYFNIGRLNRSRMFELFRNSSIAYRDIAGLLRITRHDDASLNSGAVASALSEWMSSYSGRAPVIVFVDDGGTLQHAIEVLPQSIKTSVESWFAAQIEVDATSGTSEIVLRTRDGHQLKFQGKHVASDSIGGESQEQRRRPGAPFVVDIGILTIREDEFRAVLSAFPHQAGLHKGRVREYALRYADAGDGERYTVAIVRQAEQGNGEAQDAARDLIEDLEPALLLVVGIAGGLPSDDVTLGDVVLSTRIHDFSVEARKTKAKPTYAISGGPVSKLVASSIANLAAREKDLGAWADGLPSRPSVNWKRKDSTYGPPRWREELREKLEGHFGDTAIPRSPIYVAGPIASSDRLVKDPKVLFPWIESARNLLAVEMESGGVYRAARERCAMLAIRGISDIVGLKRSDAWTKFACESAAAFAKAYLKTRPVPLTTTKTIEVPKEDVPEIELLYSNLVPLTSFPTRIYNAPATVASYEHAWAVLKKGQSAGHIPRSWILHNRNVYSFTDPEESGLSNIVDVGSIESNSSMTWAETADPDQHRLFVQLLNNALRDDLGAKGVWFFADDNVFAFAGRPGEEPRTYTYQNVRLRSAITVVQHYKQEGRDGRKFTVMRHLGFQGRFRRIDEQFFLEVTPTYRFTMDGKKKDRFHDKRLSGIKRLERNRAVLSQVRLWNDLLMAQLGDRTQLLSFGVAPTFEIQQQATEQLQSDESCVDESDPTATHESSMWGAP